LKLAAMGGMGVFLPAVITACNDDPLSPTLEAGFNFGTDRGALNFAYAYNQFMADFYQRVQINTFVGMTTNESDALNTILGHKTSQRNTLQYLIPSGRITDSLLFNFSSVDFSDRDSVMGFAQTFEDLGVATINGTASTVKDARNLLMLGRVVSVWARHSAVIRDLNDIAAGDTRDSFADTTDSNGLDPATSSSAAITAMQPYFRTSLSTSGA
jgi:hypothetical protein